MRRERKGERVKKRSNQTLEERVPTNVLGKPARAQSTRTLDGFGAKLAHTERLTDSLTVKAALYFVLVVFTTYLFRPVNDSWLSYSRVNGNGAARGRGVPENRMGEAKGWEDLTRETQ